MSVPAGTVIGHYRIERPIGSGGFATVYLAHDDRLDATVAIKMLADNRALEIDARRRFVEEAQKLRKVGSNSVVTVYDVGETSGHQPYMVLEYADRGDLAARCAVLGRQATVEECCQVAAFLHEALSALHRVGLVHRDVKPHNILIRTESGPPQSPGPLLAGNERLLLGDLGFVKDLNLASGLTVGGGTWAYQAPEQRFRFGTVDPRADVYSATAVIAWLLTGAALVEGQRWSDLLAQVAMEPAVRTELLRGLAETPEERHATIDDWWTALDTALRPPPPPQAATAIMPSAPAPTAIMPSAPAPTGISPPPSRARRSSRRLAMLGIGALALAGSGFAAGMLLGADDDAKEQVSVNGATRTTEATVGGYRVLISGPEEIRVGEPATFVTEVSPEVSASWIYPDGTVVASGSGVVYTADTEGTFTVSLLVVAPGSAPQLVVHEALAVQ